MTAVSSGITSIFRTEKKENNRNGSKGESSKILTLENISRKSYLLSSAYKTRTGTIQGEYFYVSTSIIWRDQKIKKPVNVLCHYIVLKLGRKGQEIDNNK